MLKLGPVKLNVYHMSVIRLMERDIYQVYALIYLLYRR